MLKVEFYEFLKRMYVVYVGKAKVVRHTTLQFVDCEKKPQFTMRSLKAQYLRVAVVVVIRPSRSREDTGGTETGYST